ncbi:MAG TPA: nucleotide exchange factor GrpE [Vitreimonas sp.]|uniref:nucleotide exchange factor GrpE n=1 Tax=Vitreimonas sp. TaxID=3069702 RepID=UPI002D671850|nr:nucleotide exchange factor GrpE [Vitreimonas sp.]HYD89610.1 nucleotide exchange factor GrpE [Vitreimonas sp.]
MTNETDNQQQVRNQQDEAPAETLDTSVLEAELAKARDDMLRALAEVENTRRRAERQAAEARAYAIDRFAADLLPIADTLGRALAAAPQGAADEATRNLIAGLELTERTMVDVFARHGLKRVGAKGEAFNPNLHQAVAQAPSDQPAGVILEVMQPGYVLNDRTLRAAMVLVSAGGGASAAAPTVDVKV